MSQIDEAAYQQQQLAAALRDSLEQTGLTREVIFQAYTKVILPLDGYVFWSPTVQIERRGVLHFSQQIVQEETETLGLATVTFVTGERVTEFAQLGDNTLFIAQLGDFRAAFSTQGGFQDDAKLWHYSGQSVWPALASQLLDNPAWLDAAQPIVSNSLPFWLQLNNWSTPFADWFSNTGGPNSILPFPLMFYPSKVVTPNLKPPYVSVHIGPEDTRTVQPVAYLDQNRSSWQLCVDRVRLTLVGLQNNAAIDVEQMILQYFEYGGSFASDGTFTGNMGLMGNGLTVQDKKRNQIELQALAMEKTLTCEVSYLQSRVASVARNTIAAASFALQLNQAA